MRGQRPRFFHSNTRPRSGSHHQSKVSNQLLTGRRREKPISHATFIFYCAPVLFVFVAWDWIFASAVRGYHTNRENKCKMSKLQGEEYATDAQCVSVQYVINAFFAWLRRRAGSGTTKGLYCRAHKERNCRNWSV
jgi:hypothetical protein